MSDLRRVIIFSGLNTWKIKCLKQFTILTLVIMPTGQKKKIKILQYSEAIIINIKTKKIVFFIKCSLTFWIELSTVLYYF